jgi:hypothetical protein
MFVAGLSSLGVRVKISVHGDYKETLVNLATLDFRDRWCRISLDFIFASSHLDRKESTVVGFHLTLRGFMFLST